MVQTPKPNNRSTEVLIIDDDEELNGLLIQYLGRYGYSVHACIHPAQGLRQLKCLEPDVVILDVMLPDMDGFELCRTIRQTYSIPILMLTARGDVLDRILGLEMGADDYLPKPFEPRELVARIQAILRRGASIRHSEVLRAGELVLSSATMSASLRGSPLDLTTAEFTLLELLIGRRGRVLSREQILDATRGLEGDSFDRSIDVLISRLRHKLDDDPKDPKYIKTVWGRGYCFIGGDRE